MSEKDGYDRIKRIKRNLPDTIFQPLDLSTLLSRAVTIAEHLRYYNEKLESDGHFDQFLSEIKALANGKDISCDGNMEPSQALLLVLIQHLTTIGTDFNNRWDHFSQWYIEQYLKVKPWPVSANTLWITLKNKADIPFYIPRNFKFVTKGKKDTQFVYRSEMALQVHNIIIQDAFAIHFNDQKNCYPAKELHCVSSVIKKDLYGDSAREEYLFEGNSHLKESSKFGFQICSPALLLREGKRRVKISFLSENDLWLDKIKELLLAVQNIYSSNSEEKYLTYLLNNIFYLSISTVVGWSNIERYSVKIEEQYLVLTFNLLEDFPETAPCQYELHQKETPSVCLEVRLNFDAWLYPYSWLSLFLLKTVYIHTQVEGISDILLYNDLGKIDTSKPFAPFGISTECGTWMVIGNYEMVQKETQQMDVLVQWENLPMQAGGLEKYYAEYEQNITNQSFKLKIRFLSDAKWQDIPTHVSCNLFETENVFLKTETLFKEITIDKMPIVHCKEENYAYNIKTKEGFVSFVLTAPEMGFGEKAYRTLFSGTLSHNVLKKKKRKIPQEPIRPNMARITLNYQAVDKIDIRKIQQDGKSEIYHILEFNSPKVYPNRNNRLIPLIYSLPAHANIILRLQRVKGGEILNLFLDFKSLKKEQYSHHCPQIKFYIGNGYDWDLLPDDSIVKDDTRSLQESGCMILHLPKIINEEFMTTDQTVWLMISIFENEIAIPTINAIYLNAVKLKLETKLISDEDWQYFTLPEEGNLHPEPFIAALSEINMISLSSDNQRKEEWLERKIRVAEHITHQNRAVSSRDYERMVLQAFPHIAKVKCFNRNENLSEDKKKVTLVVLPRRLPEEKRNWRPQVTVRQLFEIEKFFHDKISPSLKGVDAINPLFEEIKIRCDIAFKKNYNRIFSRIKLQLLFNQIIAPWQLNEDFPEFGHTISLQALYQTILKQNFIESIHSLSVIRLTQTDTVKYALFEYGRDYDAVPTSHPYSIFIPSENHLLMENETTFYGIGEMDINDNLIIQ